MADDNAFFNGGGGNNYNDNNNQPAHIRKVKPYENVRKTMKKDKPKTPDAKENFRKGRAEKMEDSIARREEFITKTHPFAKDMEWYLKINFIE